MSEVDKKPGVLSVDEVYELTKKADAGDEAAIQQATRFIEAFPELVEEYSSVIATRMKADERIVQDEQARVELDFPRGSAARNRVGRCGNPRFLRQLRDESSQDIPQRV